jgi:hypothetical protein
VKRSASADFERPPWQGQERPPAPSHVSPYVPPQPEHEESIQHSLFGEILDWMLAPLLLLWPMSIAITYLVAKSIANQPFDHALEDSVTVLAQQVKQVDGRVVARLPGSARDFLRADDVDNVYFQVSAPDGAVVDGGSTFATRACMARRCASPMPGSTWRRWPTRRPSRRWRWCRWRKRWINAPSSPTRSSRA